MRITVNNAGALRIIKVASGAQGPQGPIGALNADDRAYVDAAKASASASEASASASATIATTAQNSATASAAAASLSETNSAAAEVSSATSASTATAAATNLVTALAAFREVYLGSFAADPAVDGNGNPLKDGAEYYNTTTERIRVYSGGAWQDKDAAEQQETTNAALSAASAAAAAAAAGTSETNAAGSAATASAGAATVAAAVTASAASATAAEASASSANDDKTAAATSAAAAAQSAIDAENNAGGALPLTGGILVGPVTSKYASPTYTMADASQASGAGVFRWTSVGGVLKFLRNTAAGGDFSNSTTPLSIDATDVATFSQRPVFGANVPWDRGNLVAPLTAADNLNGVANKATARTNLGVGRTLLSTQVINVLQAFVTFLGLDTTYDDYEIEAHGMITNVNVTQLVAQFSTDNGVTWDASANHSNVNRFVLSSNASGAGGNESQGVVLTGFNMDAVTVGIKATFILSSLGSAADFSQVNYTLSGLSSGHLSLIDGCSMLNVSAAHNAFRLFMAGGVAMLKGTFRLYGINK
jgi:hypothetical protein